MNRATAFSVVGYLGAMGAAFFAAAFAHSPDWYEAVLVIVGVFVSIYNFHRADKDTKNNDN